MEQPSEVFLGIEEQEKSVETDADGNATGNAKSAKIDLSDLILTRKVSNCGEKITSFLAVLFL